MLHVFVQLSHIPLSGQTTVCLFISCWTFGLSPLFGLMNDAAMNIHVQGICVTLFSVLLSKFLGIEWLGHRVTLGLTF